MSDTPDPVALRAPRLPIDPDPWAGTDEEEDSDQDSCHHGTPFDEDCYWCDDETWDEEHGQ